MVDLSSKDVAALKAQAHDLPAKLQVGKAGITDAFVSEVDDALKRDRLVKLKLLRSARGETDRRDLGRELAERTRAALVEVRGNTVVLYRPRGGQR